MVKILFTADLHIGFQDNVFPESGDIRALTFRKIAALAREHDIVLIAGDLFHFPDPGKELIDLVGVEFAAIRDAGVEIVFTPGEHDLTDANTLPEAIESMRFSRVFRDSSGAPFVFEKNGQTLHVYGLPPVAASGIDSIRGSGAEGFHIGLFHAEVNLRDEQPGGRVPVLRKRDLRDMGLDFYALGHHHNYKIYKNQDLVIGAYPGTPESTSFDEHGERYVLSLTVEDNRLSQIRRLLINSRNVVDMEFDCTGVTSPDDVLAIAAEHRAAGSVARITLRGERSFAIDTTAPEGAGEGFVLFDDKTIPSIELLASGLAGEDSLRGEFFALFAEKLAANAIPADAPREILSVAIRQIGLEGRCDPEEWQCG
jgi:DNA repair exonuclease SbcCD nuclease subunit